MSQREKMTVAVSDVCSPHPTICWPVSFQTQFGTGDIYMVKRITSVIHGKSKFSFTKAPYWD